MSLEERLYKRMKAEEVDKPGTPASRMQNMFRGPTISKQPNGAWTREQFNTDLENRFKNISQNATTSGFPTRITVDDTSPVVPWSGSPVKSRQKAAKQASKPIAKRARPPQTSRFKTVGNSAGFRQVVDTKDKSGEKVWTNLNDSALANEVNTDGGWKRGVSIVGQPVQYQSQTQTGASGLASVGQTPSRLSHVLRRAEKTNRRLLREAERTRKQALSAFESAQGATSTKRRAELFAKAKMLQQSTDKMLSNGMISMGSTTRDAVYANRGYSNINTTPKASKTPSSQKQHSLMDVKSKLAKYYKEIYPNGNEEMPVDLFVADKTKDYSDVNWRNIPAESIYRRFGTRIDGLNLPDDKLRELRALIAQRVQR